LLYKRVATGAEAALKNELRNSAVNNLTVAKNFLDLLVE
jgi:hypothetical protein